MGKTLVLEREIARTRLSDTVYETLLESITSGKLTRGAIVSEVALAKQLEVSRTPVHDALRQLAKDGLVEQRAGHRAVITAFTREDVADIFAMRKLLEGEAARRAATRIDPAKLAELKGQVNELRRINDSSEWLARWAEFEDAFHDGIARASGSCRLWHDIARYRLLHRSFNTLAATCETLQGALDEHVAILDAIEHRDGERAAKLMGEHIAKWQAYFVEKFSH